MSAVVVRHERNGANLRKWVCTFAAILLANTLSPASAQTGPMSGEITAACMQAMDESETVCACIEDDATLTLTSDQQTFLLALLTEDETLVQSLDGFTNEDAELVRNQMINAGMSCLG